MYTNNREATRRALESGASGRPTAAEEMAAVDGPANPFLRIGIDQLASFEH